MRNSEIAQIQSPGAFALVNLRVLGLLLVFCVATSPAVAFQTNAAQTQTNNANSPGAHPAQTTVPGASVPEAGKTASGPVGQQRNQPVTSPTVSAPGVTFLTLKDGGSYCGQDPSKNESCRLGSTLFVGITNLKDWMADSNNHPSDLTLVLNGRVMKGLTARGPDGSYSGLQFDLKMLDGTGPDHADNRDAWSALITELRSNSTLHVAVASGGNPPFWGSAAVTFMVFAKWDWVVLVFLLLMLVGFFIMAVKSDILRDAPSVGNVKQTFSLARCQMAWWFFIIAASYCYIWLALNNHDSLTQGALILTGISAATGLAATVIDGGKRNQRNKLVAEQTVVQARVNALPAAISSAPAEGVADLQAELADKTKRLSDIATALAALPSPTGASEGFLMDILRDETGISLYRFQMVGWTVILGFVFVVGVHSQLTMPDFSPTLLGLMGISSGTYVGFKVPDPPK